MTLLPRALEDIDYWDLDMFSSGDPHAAWRIQRNEAPVWWHDRAGGEPFWSVSRYDDGRAVFGDPVRFSSQANGIVLRTNEMLGRQAPAAALGINPMIHTDPPRHRALRKVVSHRFIPQAIGQLEQRIRGFARAVIDEATERGEVDFVTDVAHRIPAQVTFSLLDVPPDAWDRLADLEHQTITSADPEFTHGQSAVEASAAAGAEIFGYFAELVQARLANLDDDRTDILSEFLRGRVDDETLPWTQVVAEAGLLLAGGLDTTRAAASAGAMVPLLQHRDQLRALQDDPGLIPVAVEEFVRWASPIVSEARTATVDTEIGEQQVRAGDRVVVWGPSCNRDAAQFDEPDRYDIRRADNRHLGFSYGEHYCLGVHLARLILTVEFEELFARCKGFELAGEPVRVRSNFVGGLKHLPLVLTPR
jgi:cholest-4-en-3-one 26-monooxygenase